ncbi:MAG: tripartite tricarboxylate transporter substrate binding protein [Bacillota bacterium]
MIPFRVLLRAALALCLAFAALDSGAQPYPSKPIKLIVGFPPGGGSDAAARILAAALQDKLGQSVVVDNKPGANTIVATQYVGSQPADGYTLLFVSASFAINPSLYKLDYDIQKSFTPVALVVKVPLMLVASNGLPAKSVREIIALAKERPGELTYASFGVGSAGHLAGELFCAMTGTNIRHVPYKGSAPAITDLIGGRVSFMFPGIGSAVPFVKEGKLKAIAVTTATRTPIAPDVPTVAEAGVPGYEVATWESVQAPAGTPRDVVATLNKAIGEVLATRDVRDKMAALGLEADGTKNPAEVAQFVASEKDKWAKVVKDRDVKVE